MKLQLYVQKMKEKNKSIKNHLNSCLPPVSEMRTKQNSLKTTFQFLREAKFTKHHHIMAKIH